jgi:DnaJ domain
MPNFLIALVIVVGGLWFIRKLAKTPPAAMPLFMKKMGGMGLILAGTLILLRGNVNAALPILLLGLAMVGISTPFGQAFSWSKGRAKDQKSRVVTSILAMELDHGSGAMDGDVLLGPLRGRRVTTLSDQELQQLYALCKSTPDQSRMLLEAWLDRQKDTWRADWQEYGKAAPSNSGKMSRDEAYAVLGLKPGASMDDVKSAHRRLMKDFHPDKGGSDYLAAKVNQAKDVLTD